MKYTQVLKQVDKVHTEPTQTTVHVNAAPQQAYEGMAKLA
jgi:hypothetical protein